MLVFEQLFIFFKACYSIVAVKSFIASSSGVFISTNARVAIIIYKDCSLALR
jgi:hypothetical protein